MRYSITLLLLCIITFNANSQSDKYFKPGYYYNLKGEKKSGLIANLPLIEYVFFKTDQEAKKVKIKFDSIAAVVIDHDSLVVLNYENYEKRLCNLVAVTPTCKIFCHHTIRFRDGGTIPGFPRNAAGAMQSRTSLTNSSIYIYQKGEVGYAFTRGKYKEILAEAFAEFPDLVKKIEDKEIKYTDLNKMIAEYNELKRQKRWAN